MTQLELERELLGRPVQALQYMLTRLALAEGELPVVAQSGRFDDGTLEAVLLFQGGRALPVTGVVDRETWQALYRAWQRAEEQLAPPRSLRAFPGNGKTAPPGEWREFLPVPQVMLQSLAHHFNGPVPDAPDGQHTDATGENIRWVQQAAGLEPTGILDRQAWDALSRLYEVFILPDGIPTGELFPAWG